jgi:hypothetical protein
VTTGLFWRAGTSAGDTLPRRRVGGGASQRRQAIGSALSGAPGRDPAEQRLHRPRGGRSVSAPGEHITRDHRCGSQFPRRRGAADTLSQNPFSGRTLGARRDNGNGREWHGVGLALHIERWSLLACPGMPERWIPANSGRGSGYSIMRQSPTMRVLPIRGYSGRVGSGRGSGARRIYRATAARVGSA